MNEDSPGHFLRGQTYLQKLTTGRDRFPIPNLQSPFLFAPGQRISLYKFNVYETQLAPLRPVVNQEGYYTRQKQHEEFEKKYGRSSFYKHNSWAMNYWLNTDGGHPPVSDMLEALSNKIFHEKLGIAGDVEGYYIYGLILAALTVFAVYYFVRMVWGEWPAVFASAGLAMYPLFFSESHFNIKDIPELSYFALSTIAFYFWVETRKKRWSAVFFASFFLGVGTKLNILFLPIILIIWLVLFRKSRNIQNFFNRRIIISTIGISFILFILFIFSWPYLWDAPFQKIIETLAFYKITSGTNLQLQEASPYLINFLNMDLRGILYVITMSPLLMLVFFIAGLIVFYVRRSNGKEQQAACLVLLWMLIPILRVLRPGADVFESMRQYMEFLPAFAVISGVGATGLIRLLSKKINQPSSRIFQIAGGVYFAYLAVILMTFHPNQNVFFNSLTGGTAGAAKAKLFGWQTSYNNPYRQLAVWLNKNAAPNSKLAFLDGTMIGMSPLFLRNDIYFGTYFSSFDMEGEYIASIVYPSPPAVFPYLYLEHFLKPVHEVKAGGLVIAKIWKNEAKYLKKQLKQKQITGVFKPEFGEDIKGAYWQVRLGDSQSVTAVRLVSPNDSCIRMSGLWKLDDYVLPRRVGRDDTVTDFYFPGSRTGIIRYYGISPENCFGRAQIESVTVLE